MTLTLTVTAETPQEMASVLQTLGGNTLVTVQQTTNTGTKPKAEKPAKEQPEAKTATADTSNVAEKEPKADKSADEVTIEQVRQAATKQIQAGKRDAVAALLAECGATMLTQLKPAQFAYFLDKANAL
ncbi:hypothetical protein JST56_07135 [Candidatus Dependentiae bacterium]|nr:hypothetical protein [Candidatus Dependentiae bacterium]